MFKILADIEVESRSIDPNLIVSTQLPFIIIIKGKIGEKL